MLYFETDFGLIIGIECTDQIFFLRCLTFGNIREDRVGLKNFVDVFLSRRATVASLSSDQCSLLFVSPGDHFIAITGDLEAFAGFFQSNRGDVRQTDLVRRGEDFRGHFTQETRSDCVRAIDSSTATIGFQIDPQKQKMSLVCQWRKPFLFFY